MSSSRQILSLSTTDAGGGAEKMAVTLQQGFRDRGWDSRMLVGKKQSIDPDVAEMHASPWFDYDSVRKRREVRFQKLLLWRDKLLGREAFQFPFTRWLTSLAGQDQPRAILAHNLHGGYFDLRMLPGISQTHKVFCFLHDLWPLTGHCAFPFDCDRWETGCGKCPYLGSPPALLRDNTASNWKRKKSIYRDSKLHVIVPCQWLASKVEKSILGEHCAHVSVIPYGIDLDKFSPADTDSRRKLRQEYGFSDDELIAVFIANYPTRNPYKNFAALEGGMPLLERLMKKEMPDAKRLRILVLGEPEAGILHESDQLSLELLPYTSNAKVVSLLQLADFYLHPSHQEITPVAIYEAMACGLPVIASSVGGIPEMITEGEEGFLLERDNSESWSQTILEIIRSPENMKRMGLNSRSRMEALGGASRMLDQVEQGLMLNKW